MPKPHNGLIMAAAAAGSRRKLALLLGVAHGTINYYARTGKPLKQEWAERLARELRLPLDKLWSNEQR